MRLHFVQIRKSYALKAQAKQIKDNEISKLRHELLMLEARKRKEEILKSINASRELDDREKFQAFQKFKKYKRELMDLRSHSEIKSKMASIKEGNFTQEQIINIKKSLNEDLVFNPIETISGETIYFVTKSGENDFSTNTSVALWNELKKLSDAHNTVVTEYRNCRENNDNSNSMSNCRIHALQILGIKGYPLKEMHDAMYDLISTSKSIGEYQGSEGYKITHGELAWEQTKLLNPAHELMVSAYRYCRLSRYESDTVEVCRTYAIQLAKLKEMSRESISKAMIDMTNLSNKVEEINNG